MHARISKLGLRHFAHDKRQPACPIDGESLEHQRLKALVARMARDLGYHAELEVPSTHDDQGGWRADVLVATPDGRRFAFEIQLSGMTLADGHHRTERYRSDGIATVWLSSRHAVWMCRLPSIRIVDDTADHPMVDRGLARLEGVSWVTRGPLPLADVIAGILGGSLRPTGTTGEFVETITDSAADATVTSHRAYTTRNATVLVRGSDLEKQRVIRERQHQRRLDQQRSFEEAERKRLRRIANIEALRQRRYRLLQRVVAGLVPALRPGEAIWLGGESPDPWDGTFPVPLERAEGTILSAYGALASIGSSDTAGGTWVVICPAVSRCDREMGALWRERGVRVAAEGPRDAHSIAGALDWPAHEVEIIRQGWTLHREHTGEHLDAYFDRIE